jgi:hypothetical protein
MPRACYAIAWGKHPGSIDIHADRVWAGQRCNLVAPERAAAGCALQAKFLQPFCSQRLTLDETKLDLEHSSKPC